MTSSSAEAKLKKGDLSLIEFESLRTVLEIKRRLDFTVVTGSMEPLIRTGSRIEVEKLAEPLKKFDIIVFFSRQKLVCHYLLHVNSILSPLGKKTYVTRGLANGYEDFPCDEDLIFGRVVSHKIPVLTRLMISLRSLRN